MMLTSSVVPRGKTMTMLRSLRRVLLGPLAFSTSYKSPGTLDAESIRSTAWLDGLRGIAALLVFILHHQEYGHQMGTYVTLEDPWGHRGQKHFATFPFIRLIFSGGIFAVPIFFIISGYVLSYKPLQLVHNGRHGALARSTASSLFRRWGRLFLPVYVCTFVWMSSWYVFNYRSAARGSPELLSSWTAELRRWWDNHNSGGYTGYNPHLWTIPEEFWGSIFIWCTVLATSRFTTEARLLTEFAICAYRLYLPKVDCLFMVGVIFCDISLLAEANRLPPLLKRLGPRCEDWWAIPFVLGLYLSAFGHGFATTPENFSAYPGWSLLHFLMPPGYKDFKFWYRFWGSTLAVISMPHMSTCKRLLESRIPQYLGRVSYGFYLIHGPLLWSCGVRIYAACGLTNRYPELQGWENMFRLPAGGPLGMEFQWLVPMLFMLIWTLALSELFTQFVDGPSIRFVQWMFQTGLDEEKRPHLPTYADEQMSLLPLSPPDLLS